MIAAISNYLSPLARMNPIENPLFPLRRGALRSGASLRRLSRRSNGYCRIAKYVHCKLRRSSPSNRWRKVMQPLDEAAELNRRLAKWVAEHQTIFGKNGRQRRYEDHFKISIPV